MYSSTALMNWTMAMIAAPKAKEPVWYLKNNVYDYCTLSLLPKMRLLPV